MALAGHVSRAMMERYSHVRMEDKRMTGGGGIAPGVTVHEPELNHFQLALLGSDVFFSYENSVGGFTRHYLGTRSTISKDFEADDAVMADFRKFLAGRNVRYPSRNCLKTWIG